MLEGITTHPKSTLLTIPLVFKEYLKPGQVSQKLFDNEWAMYTQLKEDAFNHIFWLNIIGLLEGLAAIDDLTRYGEDDDQSREMWHLKGTHQDIRPQNILICGEPSDDDYSVPFKFADMGLAHIRKVKNHGIDRFAVDHFGNGMYSAPEAFRDDGGIKTIRHKSDVYSLGGILSEALIWMIWGEKGREAYQAERVRATREIRLRGGYHEGAFHDGDGLLHVVEEWHQRAVEITGGKAEALSQVIIKFMLAADPDRRVFPALEDTLSRLKGNSGRNQIFILDDSISMKPHRDQVARTCRVLIKLLKKGHVDPDKEFELYFASKGRLIKAKNGTDIQTAVEKHDFSKRRCEMRSILDQVASRVMEQRHPVSLYVLTNGHWDIRNPSSICSVEKPIERLVKHIVEKNEQANWAMVQFIGFYKDPPSEADRYGKARLKYLDNDLGLER
ncbi:Serine/threonine-protein kinase chk1 [Colletotrichum sp. SAR11_59]|nr:Serine/threonine-protein kinase chk1 [Colletotrichum sp. SAR11_59]